MNVTTEYFIQSPREYVPCSLEWYIPLHRGIPYLRAGKYNVLFDPLQYYIEALTYE